RMEARACERLEDVVAREPLVVPGKRHLAHEVRVRGLEAVEPPERGAEPHDAALAADTGDLDGLGLEGHVSILRERAEPAAKGSEALCPSDSELLVGLREVARGRLDADPPRELHEELGRRDEAGAVGMDELRIAAAAKRRPPVLLIETPIGA